MADWEEQTNTAAASTSTFVKPSASKWDDEDLSEDDIKESWDDSDDSEDESKAASAPAPEVKKKVPLAQRIAERNLENERRKQENAAKQSAMGPGSTQETEEELFERRQRQRQLELDADLENAADLFAGVSIKDQDTASKIATLDPKTKAEFDEFAALLQARIQSASKQGLYAAFLIDLTRELFAPLKDVDIRKGASTLTTLANEKQKAEREKGKKGKKKAAPAIKQVSDMDNTDYGANNYADDFDDFM